MCGRKTGVWTKTSPGCNWKSSPILPNHSFPVDILTQLGHQGRGLIYPVIIWHFLLPSLSSLCRRMISETMLDLAAYLRRFYCSWLTNTPIVIQLLSAGLLKLTEQKGKDFSDGNCWILGITRKHCQRQNRAMMLSIFLSYLSAHAFFYIFDNSQNKHWQKWYPITNQVVFIPNFHHLYDVASTFFLQKLSSTITNRCHFYCHFYC